MPSRTVTFLYLNVISGGPREIPAGIHGSPNAGSRPAQRQGRWADLDPAFVNTGFGDAHRTAKDVLGTAMHEFYTFSPTPRKHNCAKFSDLLVFNMALHW